MTEHTKHLIQERIQQDIGHGITAGASVLVRQHDQEVFFFASGCADREENVPIRRDTLFRLYSMTKPITAVAAMILVERGLLDLNMPIAEVLPGFANTRLITGQPLERPITVLHLLNMTSGLTYGDDITPQGKATAAYLAACGEKLHTPQRVSTVAFAEGLATVPLAFQPDSHWCYGLSADVLGAVIEKTANQRFGDFLEKSIFSPLNMQDTGFSVPENKYNRLAKAYDAFPGGRLVEFHQDHLLINLKMDEPAAFESGGAGLVSTIDDYARFAQMLLNKGTLDGQRILSPNTVNYLLSGSLTPVQQQDYRNFGGHEGYTYSHLMRHLVDPGSACLMSSSGEYGWSGWLGCYFANIPQEDMTVLLMQQKAHSGTRALARSIRNILTANL